MSILRTASDRDDGLAAGGPPSSARKYLLSHGNSPSKGSWKESLGRYSFGKVIQSAVKRRHLVGSADVSSSDSWKMSSRSDDVGGDDGQIVGVSLLSADPSEATEDKAKSRKLLEKLMSRVLRSRATAIALVYPCFVLYDVLEWWDYDQNSGWVHPPLLIARGFFSLLIFLIAFLLTMRLNGEMTNATLRLINLALVIVPAGGAFTCVLVAPDNSVQYMFALALFQIWTGYSTLHLPTKEIAIWQLIITAVIAVAERLATDVSSFNAVVRPKWKGQAGDYQGSVNTVFIYFYLAAAHLLGIW